MSKIDSLRKIESGLQRGLKAQLLQLTRAGQLDGDAMALFFPRLGQRKTPRPKSTDDYCYPDATELASCRAQLVEYLENWVELPESPPFPCPGLPWWIGTEQDWQTFTAPLKRRGYCELDSDGKPVWKKTAGLAGIIARAAVDKGWLQGYVGEESYPAFLRLHFSWPKGFPKSKNAFDKDHASLKDHNLAQPILLEYGFKSTEIKY